MNRICKIAQHVNASGDAPSIPLGVCPTASAMSEAGKSDDDVVICSALRTPICKARRGSFKDMAPEDLLAPLYKATVDATKVNPKAIGDIQIGNASMPGAGALSARMSQFLGGIPFDAPLSVVNRQCSSGLQAVANIAASIKAGVIDIGLAGGVESMSMFPMG